MFSAEEIMDIAIKMEKNGENYYLKGLEKISNPSLGPILRLLADEEAQHARWLLEMKQSLRISPEDLEMAEISGRLLQKIVGDRKFSLDEADLSEEDTVEELINVAIEFEKDTILFYEMLATISDDPESIEVLNRIIEEENHHIRLLQEYTTS
jgi:rubrerythrin